MTVYTSCMVSISPDARERAGPVFPPPPQEETQAQRARARRDKVSISAFNCLSDNWHSVGRPPALLYFNLKSRGTRPHTTTRQLSLRQLSETIFIYVVCFVVQLS